jgi:hypothetical protein
LEFTRKIGAGFQQKIFPNNLSLDFCPEFSNYLNDLFFVIKDEEIPARPTR